IEISSELKLSPLAKDYRGVVLVAVARRMVGCFTPHLGKCMAVREGEWFALSHAFYNLVVETDAINMLQVLKNSSPRSLEVNNIDNIRPS
uniref:reverse transcriptase-like protein n=1 Tax=Proteus mirabilis TaxID=584 RepID=UPI0015C52B97